MNNTNQDYSAVNNTDFGALVGVYHKKYNADKKLETSFMYIQGYSDIVLNENNQVNIIQLNRISKNFDESKS